MPHQPQDKQSACRRCIRYEINTSAMKTATLLVVLGLFGANLPVAAASPTVNLPRANPARSWEFFLFQSPECTGPQDRYAGNGTSPCRNDIRDGNALGFAKSHISPGCTVTLFQGKNCTQSVRNITSHTESKCQDLRGHIGSFDVHCLKPHFMFRQ